jgi:hypothetical protein
MYEYESFDIVNPLTVTIFFIKLRRAAEAWQKIAGEASTVGYSSSTESEFALRVSTRELNLLGLDTFISNIQYDYRFFIIFFL